MGIAKKMKNWLALWSNQFCLYRIVNRRCEDGDDVLIIKLDAIGDFIIWLDSAKEYKKIYSSQKCILLCSSVCKDLAYATDYFDDVLALDVKKFEKDKEYQLHELDKLSSKKYKILVQTAYSRTQHMDMIAASIPATEKIGFIADESKSNVSRYLLTNFNRKKMDRVYDKLIETSKAPMMELQRNADFIRKLKNEEFKSSIPQLPSLENKLQYKNPYVVIFPGASTPVKMWGTDKYAKVIEYLQLRTNWDIWICGGKQESYLYDDICKKLIQTDNIKNYCGKTNLIDLIEVVRNAKLVLSNDTSGIHYAAATGVPGICPFGEYNYGRFLPYDSDEQKALIHICSAQVKCRNCADRHMTVKCISHIIRKGRYLCLELVTVDMVKKAIERYL